MAKKSGTRTPKKIADQKAGLAAMKGDDGYKAVLKRLADEAAEEYEAFEKRQREKREKALADLIEPLRKERNEAAQKVNELNTKISELDKQIRELTGVKEPKGGGGKRRQRKSKEEKAQIAALLYGVLKDAKEPLASGALENVAAGLPVRDLVKIWNHDNASKKITVTGAKASTRYSV